MLYTIKHRISGAVLFGTEAGSLKLAVEVAISEEANLRGADLEKADLTGTDLRGANLAGANLAGADLREADLAGADLREANLREADLAGANLREANLRGADLAGADLREANLRGADLAGANLMGAYLIDAGQDSRGYRFVAHQRDNDIYVLAGCRYLPLAEAREHWDVAHPDDLVLRAECQARIALIEAVAKARGWLGETEAAE